MAAVGVQITLADTLSAMMHDDLQAIIYQRSGGKVKKPEYITQKLLYGTKPKEGNYVSMTPEEFEQYRSRLINGET